MTTHNNPAVTTAAPPQPPELQMERLVREFDWSRTSLGPIDQWPRSLQTAVGICLHSRFPMFVWWGSDLINLYNDAYVPILGQRHGTALGRPARELWSEVWPQIATQIDAVMTRGEASWNERTPLTVYRNGFPELAYFTWSHSPIFDEAGKVGGLLCVVTEDTERVRAEELRRMTEFRFQRLIEHSPQSTQLMHPDGRTRQVNRAFEKLFGITIDQLHDYNMLRDPGLAQNGVLPLMQRAFAGEAVTIPAIPYVPDRGDYAGQTRWAGASVYPVKDDADRVEEVVLVHHDVTEQRQAEEALRRNEQQLRSLIEQSAAGIAHTDLTGHIEFANERFCQMVGFSADELSNTRVQDLTHPEDVADTERLIAEGVSTGHEYAMEKRYVRKDGSIVWVVVSASIIKGLAGTPQSIMGVVIDISDRKRAENELRAQSVITQTVASNAAEALYLLDIDGNVTYANPAAELMFGWTSQDMQGKRLHDLVHYKHTDGRPFAMEECRVGQCFASGRTLRNHEDVFVHQDGSFVPVLCSMASIRHDGRPTGAVLAVIDITDRKRAEEERQALLDAERAARTEADRASRMKDEFLATLSHELRTPLSAILGWSQILRRGNAKPDTLAEGLNTIERNARAQTQIIEDLLDMSRIISGKIGLDPQRIDLAAVVHSAIETVRATATAKGVEIAFSQTLSTPHTILGDPNRLQQVFWNLLSNAIKFTPRGGVVDVRLGQQHSQWNVEVTDTGEGIAPDFLPFVFDRFRQADASTTRRHGGLGLGLAIVKQLVELHGGTVRVQSEGVGTGTTFIVSLPVSVVREDAARQPDRAATPDDATSPVRPEVAWDASLCEGIRGTNVLVVDDEADARVLLKRLLEDCGCAVRVAATADEALAFIRERRPDVLVSDIGMPNEDGYALLRRVRELGGPTIPAIALTAYARAEDRVKAIRAGFQMHVPKPVEPTELVTMVSTLVGRGNA